MNMQLNIEKDERWPDYVVIDGAEDGQWIEYTIEVSRPEYERIKAARVEYDAVQALIKAKIDEQKTA